MMKIWIITSWFENLALFKFLNKYDHEYHIYWDWNNWSYWDKWFEYSFDKVEEWIKFLKNKKVDYIIVSPIYEMNFFIKNNNDKSKKIFPLFKNYLYENCLKYSLIWKLWFVWEYSDIQINQKLFDEISKDYILTDNQQKIKKFHQPFVVWNKTVDLWKSFFYKISFRSFTISKIIKSDLRYLKDAWIDTLIPLNYWYFLFEKLIDNKLNFNKMRFHGIDKLEKSFINICKDIDIDKSKYSINIYHNWTVDFLKNEKKWMRLLCRWKGIEIDFKNIND